MNSVLVSCGHPKRHHKLLSKSEAMIFGILFGNIATKIIPPFGKSMFHRLAVAEGDTYASAQAAADGMKGGEYGDKVWVIKY